MRRFSLMVCLVVMACQAIAIDKDSTTYYLLPDSVKAVQFYAELNIKYTSDRKEVFAGLQTDAVNLFLESHKNEKEIVFEFPKSASIVASGLNTDKEKGEISFEYNWSSSENYKLLISQATDSAGNFSLYSGYVFLSKENKWKFIGTCKINGRWNSIQQPATVFSNEKNQNISAHVNQVWVQRNSGSWKNLLPATNFPNPQINLFGHLDSVAQRSVDSEVINRFIKGYPIKDGVAYSIIKEGTGKQVAVTDTVTVFYHLNLLNDTATVDQAKETPARFPLNRLIRGWQIGVPLIKVGGKIRLIIPSDLAYSIRTRSPKIPPNSILDFEIEIVDAKSP